jgi:hypothetical protein
LSSIPQFLPPPVWGAIAYSPSSHGFGWASRQISQSHAENYALNECGPDAVLAVSGNNTFIALAVGDTGAIGWGWGDDLRVAEGHALQECGQHAGRCRIAVSFHTTSEPEPAAVMPSGSTAAAPAIEPTDEPVSILDRFRSRFALHVGARQYADLPGEASPKPDHAPEWLWLGVTRGEQISSRGPVLAYGLPAARRERLIEQAVRPATAPRAYLHRGALPAVAGEPECIHLDLTGECRSQQHRHVVWDPRSPGLVQAAFVAQTIADIDSDPESSWRPPWDSTLSPAAQIARAVNPQTYNYEAFVIAALWTDIQGPFDPASIETFCETPPSALIAACKERAAQTGTGTYVSKSLDEICSRAGPSIENTRLGGALRTVAELARAAGRIASERLDLNSWLGSNAPLVITLPRQPSVEEVDVINALLGCAHFLGLNGRATQAPIVVWEMSGELGLPSPLHGPHMEHGPRWLVCTDDLDALFGWNKLIDSAVGKPESDWLIGAAIYQYLLTTEMPFASLELKEPFGERAVFLREGGDQPLLLDG